MSGRGDWTAGADLAAVGIDPDEEPVRSGQVYGDESVRTCLGDNCRELPRQGPDTDLARRWNREVRLVGLDMTVMVGEARMALYLDDRGELVLDEWIGQAEMGAVIDALNRALRMVDEFRSS